MAAEETASTLSSFIRNLPDDLDREKCWCIASLIKAGGGISRAESGLNVSRSFSEKSGLVPFFLNSWST
ncbi:hypothetical protein [Flavihumibacter sp. CACIAM 22H1]|uniref:hypothetical protein n=1 Tax=Flavihumibacter sp. CACIAM 22H1 TaxID=1812911 RepID=UPI0025C5FED6|nr:hypothetical protein [Flavihumibacter sp. CACIAM 22H1]